ncbi:hypothetical protein B9T34_14235 [Acinetobacter sp. ANC 3813]|nr:hypothetical protein B9T34_14235 [Acinetobacter sp. ANC 3813]
MLPVEQKKVLEQIFNFVILTPSFEDKSEFMRLKMFFSELHESNITEFEAIKPYSFKFGFGGVVRRINTLHAPRIMNSEAFIEWLSSNLE